MSPSRKVEFKGLILRHEKTGKKEYVFADAEESWVFQLPQGFLFFNGEEALWAPSLRALTLRLAGESLAEAVRQLREAREELPHAENDFWKNYWRQQLAEYGEFVEKLKALARGVAEGRLVPELASFEEINEGGEGDE